MSDYSVVVTTYSRRFDDFLVPLIKSINEYRPGVEVLVQTNGPVSGKFDQDFRSRVLSFCSQFPNVFPRLFPKQASFSRLVNDGVINSNYDNALLLNDDVTIESHFFDAFEGVLEEEDTSFLMNRSFSHSLWKKSELDEVGYFDERFVGFGWEDVDFWIRYAKTFAHKPKTINVPGIIDHSDLTFDPRYKDEGHKTIPVGQVQEKYSMANKLIFDSLYPTFPVFPDPFWETATVDQLISIDKVDDVDLQYPYENEIETYRKMMSEDRD